MGTRDLPCNLDFRNVPLWESGTAYVNSRILDVVKMRDPQTVELELETVFGITDMSPLPSIETCLHPGWRPKHVKTTNQDALL